MNSSASVASIRPGVTRHHRRAYVRSAALLTLCAALSCRDAGGRIDGAYAGQGLLTLNNTTYPFGDVAFTLSQHGAHVHGTLNGGYPEPATLDGDISASTLNATVTRADCTDLFITGDAASLSFPLTATIDSAGVHLSGTYGGTICGNAFSVQFDVTRQ